MRFTFYVRTRILGENMMAIILFVKTFLNFVIVSRNAHIDINYLNQSVIIYMDV